MSRPIFLRPLTSEETQAIQTGLHSCEAFVLRRCQILRASARGETAPAIARELGCGEQTVRNVIHGFNAGGLAVLEAGSTRPLHQFPAFAPDAAQRLGELLHHSPREFGRATSLWTLSLLAQVSFEQGLTEQLVSYESIRRVLARLGLHWKRAKHWITSPDPQYQQKKNDVMA